MRVYNLTHVRVCARVQILYEPVYNVLRTQEQLGYTVHSGMRLTHGILGFCVVVMSGGYFAG